LRTNKKNVLDRICGVLVNVHVSSTVDCQFWSCQSKEYKNGICYFSVKHTVLRSKSKDCLAWNQDNVFEWSDMSTCRMFQCGSTRKIQLSMLV